MTTKKIVSAILAVSMLSALSGCQGRVYNSDVQPSTTSQTQSTASSTESTASQTDSGNSVKVPEDGGFKTVSYDFSNDKYRTFYEIFPYSFYDSNGDGIGDLNGIIHQLDYLNDGDTSTTDDLGIEGIWLMPIMQSPSYHKYDVQDYMTVDKDYGTNDDMKKLVEEAHKRHINVIIDFVINHSSRQHEWFQKAKEELKEGKTDGYADYYHFEKNSKKTGWNPAGVDDWYYESEFSPDMPDLNLKNESLQKELQDIVKYWLTEIGVDGFRLDAVWWFESGNTSTNDEGSIEELKWFYDYAKSIKEDVYMVGECWKPSLTISEFYKSGVDSFFNFDMEGATGRVNASVNGKDAKGFVQFLETWQNDIRGNNPNAIDTPFISNHDTGRSAGFIPKETNKRLAASLYLMSPGNPFIYYGDEIGMTGSQNDPEKRTGMYWSATDTTGYVPKIPGASADGKPDKSVEEQLADEDSLLNFYKKAVALRNQNPEIARGTLKFVDLGSTETAGYVTEYNGSKVMVIFNLSGKSATFDIPEDTFKVNEVRGYLKASVDSGASASKSADDDFFGTGGGTGGDETDDVTEFTVSGQTVTMPGSTVIVLK